MVIVLDGTADGSTPYVLRWRAPRKCNLYGATGQDNTNPALITLGVANPRTESAGSSVCGLVQGSTVAAELAVIWTGRLPLDRDDEVWIIFTNVAANDDITGRVLINDE